MNLLDPETRRKIQFDKIWGGFEPLSEPGRRAHRNATPFFPGHGDALNRHFERMQTLVDACAGGKIPPRVFEAFGKIRGTELLGEASSSWGVLELAQMREIMNALRDIATWASAVGDGAWGLDFDPEVVRGLLNPHYNEKTGFAVRLQGVHEQKILLALKEARAKFNAVSGKERDDIARILGITAARLRTDLVVDRGEGRLREILDSTGHFVIIESTPWQVKYRYVPGKEVEKARECVNDLLGKISRLEEAVITRLRETVAMSLDGVQATMVALGALDLAICQAQWAVKWSCNKPV
ncbi:hypothetical protein KKF84_18310, partial [Myxococcota bacterium]|nr:hypothetical protein [Myxococcota bacterium]